MSLPIPEGAPLGVWMDTAALPPAWRALIDGPDPLPAGLRYYPALITPRLAAALALPGAAALGLMSAGLLVVAGLSALQGGDRADLLCAPLAALAFAAGAVALVGVALRQRRLAKRREAGQWRRGLLLAPEALLLATTEDRATLIPRAWVTDVRIEEQQGENAGGAVRRVLHLQFRGPDGKPWELPLPSLDGPDPRHIRRELAGWRDGQDALSSGP